MNTFETDLTAGKSVEDILLEKIKTKYPKAERFEGKCKPFDIYIPETNIYLEVKSDQKSQHTGNIVIELEMFGKPSGLNSTKSDYWVIYTGVEWLWLRPQRIWECVSINMLKPVQFVGKGDSVAKTAYLVPLELLKNYQEQK